MVEIFDLTEKPLPTLEPFGALGATADTAGAFIFGPQDEEVPDC